MPRFIPSDARRQRHVCQECGISVLGIKEHTRIVHLGIRNYLCQFCDKKYKDKGALTKHIEAQHTNNNTCPYCGKMVKYLDGHLRKMKCYLPPDERPNLNPTKICKKCGKTIPKKSIKSHMDRFHGELKQCHLCDFKTKYPHNLKMHIKTVHEKKPVKETCPHCNKTCVSLDWHILTYHQNSIIS